MTPRVEPDEPPAPPPLDTAPEAKAPEAAKPGLIGRLFGRGGEEKTVLRRVLDDDMLEQLEELLISTDMGVDTALRVTANMAEGRMGKKLSVPEIKTLLAQEIARIMEPVARPLPLYPKKPQVVLVVGVNGSGKTTTIGKLASQFKAAGEIGRDRSWRHVSRGGGRAIAGLGRTRRRASLDRTRRIRSRKPRV